VPAYPGCPEKEMFNGCCMTIKIKPHQHHTY